MGGRIPNDSPEHLPGSTGGVLECRTFGILSVQVDGAVADIGGPKQRLLLALLLCRANSVVPVTELIDALWNGRPPRTAKKNLQVYISKLRRTFGERLGYAGRGYRLGVGPAECDLLRFEQLTRLGTRLLGEGNREEAADPLGQGIALWHEPLAEFADEPSLAAELSRWHELFLASLEDWAELAVEHGNYRLALDRLADHIRPHVLRERLGAAWMRALAAAGRVKEALTHYEFVRHTLAEELGVDPSPALAEAHRQLIGGKWDLRWTSAPPRGSGRQAPGNQLPRDLPDFVGRTTEINAVVDNFTGCTGLRVVVVSGPVGTGKTALAVHLAHLLQETFPDGQLLLDLAHPDGTPKPDALVLEELLEMVGIGGGGPPRDHAVARWRSWIAKHRVLLVLDNATCEDLVRALLPGCGPSGVIVAARSRLSGLESVPRVRLGALSEAESRELLARILGLSRMLADRPAVAKILDHCEGSPLAVRIVGAKLAALRHVALADYADRLADSRLVLDELASGGLTLRGRHDAFHRSLPELPRAALRRLAALPPPPFEHGRLMGALANMSVSAVRALESLLEYNVLAAPDAEVSAHCLAYEMSAFGYQHCKAVTAEHERTVVRQAIPSPRAGVTRLDAAGNP